MLSAEAGATVGFCDAAVPGVQTDALTPVLSPLSALPALDRLPLLVQLLGLPHIHCSMRAGSDKACLRLKWCGTPTMLDSDILRAMARRPGAGINSGTQSPEDETAPWQRLREVAKVERSGIDEKVSSIRYQAVI